VVFGDPTPVTFSAFSDDPALFSRRFFVMVCYYVSTSRQIRTRYYGARDRHGALKPIKYAEGTPIFSTKVLQKLNTTVRHCLRDVCSLLVFIEANTNTILR
jgi:hypothetical protein